MDNSQRFVSVEVEGTLFLLDEGTGGSYRMSGSAPMLWQMLCDGVGIDDAAELVARRTGAAPEQVLRDARDFFDQLVERGLLDAPEARSP